MITALVQCTVLPLPVHLVQCIFTSSCPSMIAGNCVAMGAAAAETDNERAESTAGVNNIKEGRQPWHHQPSCTSSLLFCCCCNSLNVLYSYILLPAATSCCRPPVWFCSTATGINPPACSLVIIVHADAVVLLLAHQLHCTIL